MPTEQEDAIVASMAALNAGDADGFTVGMDPEIVWEPRRASVRGAYIGHDGVRAFLADNDESFEKFTAAIEETRDLGDGRVLVFGTLHIRGRGSGIETDIPMAGITEFRDGLVVRWKDHGDRAAALEAAGLGADHRP